MKHIFTMAGRLLDRRSDLPSAFTMAEILLSLTIIGVVAAITLPSLTGNINERTWNTQRKALYARMSQAISLMPALNGYGTLTEDSSEGASDAVDTATETFLTAGLSKVLKINNICDNQHLADCGIAASFTNMAGSQISMPTTLYDLNILFKSAATSGNPFSYSTINTKSAAFETQNGESITVFYNQSCRTERLNEEGLTSAGQIIGFPESNMCVNFIYDLNGSKGPNTVGKDIGIMTVFNAVDSVVVAPIPSAVTNAGGQSATYQWTKAAKACTSIDSETRIPNIDELSAMLINKDIVNLNAAGGIWSGSTFDTTRAWAVAGDAGGYRATQSKNVAWSVRCIKR